MLGDAYESLAELLERRRTSLRYGGKWPPVRLLQTKLRLLVGTSSVSKLQASIHTIRARRMRINDFCGTCGWPVFGKDIDSDKSSGLLDCWYASKDRQRRVSRSVCFFSLKKYRDAKTILLPVPYSRICQSAGPRTKVSEGFTIR